MNVLCSLFSPFVGGVDPPVELRAPETRTSYRHIWSLAVGEFTNILYLVFAYGVLASPLESSYRDLHVRCLLTVSLTLDRCWELNSVPGFDSAGCPNSFIELTLWE